MEFYPAYLYVGDNQLRPLILNVTPYYLKVINCHSHTVIVSVNAPFNL